MLQPYFLSVAILCTSAMGEAPLGASSNPPSSATAPDASPEESPQSKTQSKPASQGAPFADAFANTFEKADAPPPSAYDKTRPEGIGEEPRTLLGQLVRTVIALMVIVLLIYALAKFGLARVMKLRGVGGEQLKTLERLQLDPKSALFLVSVRGSDYLIGTGDRGVTRIHSLPTSGHKPATAAAPPRIADFRSTLDKTSVSQQGGEAELRVNDEKHKPTPS